MSENEPVISTEAIELYEIVNRMMQLSGAVREYNELDARAKALREQGVRIPEDGSPPPGYVAPKSDWEVDRF